MEFSDRMSNISLMAPGTTFKPKENFLPWEYDLHAIALLSILLRANITSNGEW